MAHATLAPSASGRWTRCPGSVALVASLPEDQQGTDNADSIRGTACHDVLAECLENQTSPQARVGQGVWVDTDDGIGTSYEFTAEDSGNVQIAINYVKKRIAEYGSGTIFMVEEKLEAGAAFHREEFDGDTLEMSYKPIPASEGLAAACWGRGDVVLIGGGFVEVIDYKNGRRHVDPVDNTQLLLYLLGALKHITPEQAPQRARLTIVQPRGEHTHLEPVRTWEFPKDGDNLSFDQAVLEHAARLGEAAVAALAADAPRTPGEEQCRWCPAKAICPEAAGAATAALTGALADAPPPPAQAPKEAPVAPETVSGGNGAEPPASSAGDFTEALTREPDALTAEQRAVVLEHEEMIRSWLKAVKAHALKLALRGEPTPGFKVVAGRRERSWTDEEDARKKLANIKRINDQGKAANKLRKDQYLVEKLLSPAQAETRLKPMVTETGWKAIERLWSWSEGKDTLVPVTDSRKEKTVEAIEDALAAAPPVAPPTEAAADDWLS